MVERNVQGLPAVGDLQQKISVFYVFLFNYYVYNCAFML
jgi:hypothetical protein